jgi:ribosomal-protein-alanine N-acetyltransferase
MRIVLETPSLKRREEFFAAVARSRRLHTPWVTPPLTAEEFDRYIQRVNSPGQVGFFVVLTVSRELAGVINLSEIVHGNFRSAYLGYYAFTPHNGQGYMTEGLHAVISRALHTLRLHRLEANIQPDNLDSKRLVKRLGFRKEGFSPRYLKIGGRWRDHERWALTAEEWRGGTDAKKPIPGRGILRA